MNSGMGHSHLNAFLAGANIPPVKWESFQRHQAEIGDAAEKVAQLSCKKALLRERKLTIKNLDKMIDLL